jgi:hypothetical protein
MIDEGDCEAIGGMQIGRGNRSTRRKTAPAPLCLPQIPNDQTRARTRAAAVGSQRLTAWTMARPWRTLYLLKQQKHGFENQSIPGFTAEVMQRLDEVLREVNSFPEAYKQTYQMK